MLEKVWFGQNNAYSKKTVKKRLFMQKQKRKNGAKVTHRAKVAVLF